jgi:hypothetical protein
MVRSLTRVISVLTILFVITLVAFAQGEKLRYQSEKGVTHQYKINTENSTKAQMGGRDFTTVFGSDIEFSLAGQDASKNGDLVFVAKVDKNLSRVDSPMMKDSAMVSKEINGKRVQLVVTPLGRTVKSVALDSIPRPANPMMGNINPPDMMRRIFVELPEKAVGTGDTWKQTRPDTISAQGMKIISKPDITFKIAGTETKGGYDCLKITFEGTASQYGTGSRQGMELVIDGAVKSKGIAYLAPKAGLLVYVESSSTNDMNISGAGEQMFTATQSVTSNSKMVLVK